MQAFKDFTIPDWFSFYRLVAAPLLIVLLILQERELFSWFLLISYATDFIDGKLARWLKVVKPEGSQIDSLGDQITFLLGVAGVMVFEWAFIREHYWVIIIAFSPYVLQMILAWLKYGKLTAFHTYLAKFSALVQAFFILWTLFFQPNLWLFYSMILIGVLETLEEIVLIFMYKHWTSDVKGIYWAVRDGRRRIHE